MKKKLIFVYAHPDDETFTAGGTILRYARRPDCETILFCATRGEAGKVGDPPRCTKRELGEVRSRELKAAADILGIDRVILRNHRDGELDRIPFHLLVDEIVQLIQAEMPQGIVTFPPHGISGHRDHQVIQRATWTALRQVEAGTKIRLYYIVIPESVSEPPKIHTTPDEDITHRIDVAPFRREIMESLRQHRTQHLSIERVFPGVLNGNWQHLRTTEYFQLISGPPNINEAELI